MHDAVIVSAVRTAVGKAPLGSLRGTRPDELAAAAIQEALRRVPAIDPHEIDDVILGCAMPEAEQGLNVARIASLRAGIPVSASAVTVNRFCSSGLQAIAFAAERVMCGFATAIVAGGTESMSLVPMGGHKVAPNPSLVDQYPDVYTPTSTSPRDSWPKIMRARPASRARRRMRLRCAATNERSRPSTADDSLKKSFPLRRCSWRANRSCSRSTARPPRSAAAGLPGSGRSRARGRSPSMKVPGATHRSRHWPGFDPHFTYTEL
jgi:hypothetical protein